MLIRRSTGCSASGYHQCARLHPCEECCKCFLPYVVSNIPSKPVHARFCTYLTFTCLVMICNVFGFHTISLNTHVGFSLKAMLTSLAVLFVHYGWRILSLHTNDTQCLTIEFGEWCPITHCARNARMAPCAYARPICSAESSGCLTTVLHTTSEARAVECGEMNQWTNLLFRSLENQWKTRAVLKEAYGDESVALNCVYVWFKGFILLSRMYFSSLSFYYQCSPAALKHFSELRLHWLLLSYSLKVFSGANQYSLIKWTGSKMCSWIAFISLRLSQYKSVIIYAALNNLSNPDICLTFPRASCPVRFPVNTSLLVQRTFGTAANDIYHI